MAKWDLSKLEKQQFNAAQARRFYMHVKEGGTLTERDVGRMVEALEEVFQMYVDANEARIDAEEKLRKSALQEMSALGQASEAYQAQKEAEAKLAKAVEALEQIAKPKIGPAFDWTEEEVSKWRAVWYQKYQDIARTTLAELKGQDDE